MGFSNFFRRQPQPPVAPSITEPGPRVSPWVAENQDTIDELARFIDFAEGFTLGIIEVNFAEDVAELLKVLRQRRESAQVEFHQFDLSDPNLRFLKDELAERLAKLPPPISLLLQKKPVLVVTGLEQSIGLLGDHPPMLQDLNFVRDGFIEAVPHPVLFCLPSYAINRIIKFAPDFWSWKSGLFRIAASHNRQDDASILALNSKKILGAAGQLERQQRVRLLEQLAQEFDPLAGERSKDDLRVAVRALTELGIVHRFAGELTKSKDALDKAGVVFEKAVWQPETRQDLGLRCCWLTWRGELALKLGETAKAEAQLQTALELNRGVDLGVKALTCSYLGRLKGQQGDVEGAIALFNQSLEILERIGDAQGKATSLNNIASLKRQQGDVEGAIALFNQSLEILERIGDAQGKATSLNNIAFLKGQQGDVEGAIALFNQSLEIDERIGNALGKAGSLNQIAILKRQQGDVEGAIALFNQSLEINERIGNAQGKAGSLHEIASLKGQQGDVEGAIALLNQSLEIFERIGNAQGKAASLNEIAILKGQQGDVEGAIALLNQSVEIKERIGHAQGKAASLHEMGKLKAQQGDMKGAIALLYQSLEINGSISYAKGKADDLEILGDLLIKQKGDFTTAIPYLEESLAIRQHIGSPNAATVQQMLDDAQALMSSS